MRSTRTLQLALCTLLGGAALPAGAQTYTFDVQYFGGGVTTLAPGSDTPTGTNVVPGESFLWTITAMGGDYWRVVSGGGFFPLMAFGVNESGARTGDFTLDLFRMGAPVFSLTEIGSEQRFVHMGTNTVALGTGLEFDVMRLAYLLTDAVVDGVVPPPNAGDPTSSTISGDLPIFGAPEQNLFSPGIAYGQFAAVPEPATSALLLGGLAVLGAVARRRRVTTTT